MKVNIDWNIINEYARVYYSLPEEDRDTYITNLYNSLDTVEQKNQFLEEITLIKDAWSVFIRPKQELFQKLLDGYKTIAAVVGRGFGKSLAASIFIRDCIYNNVIDKTSDIIIFGATADDCRRIMFDGCSGLFNVFCEEHRPTISSKNIIRFHTGHKAVILTSQDADKARGSNAGIILMDEVVAYEANQLMSLYANALASLRKDPGVLVITTTPKSNSVYGQFFKELFIQSQDPENKTILIRGTSKENEDNIKDLHLRERKYKGTTVWKEEYEAEFSYDSIQQLFKEKVIYEHCFDKLDKQLHQVCISVDPAVSVSEGKSDETGIVISGLHKLKEGGMEVYVLDDKSGEHLPHSMANIVLDNWYQSFIVKKIPTKILCEDNQGGLYITNQILMSAKIKGIDIPLLNSCIISQHVSSNKYDRAYPISQLMYDGKIHVRKNLIDLIKQLDNFTGFSTKRKADDRVDAMCAGINYLCFDKKENYKQRNLNNLPSQ